MDIYDISQADTVIAIARLLLDEAEDALTCRHVEPFQAPGDNSDSVRQIIHDQGGLDRIESVRQDQDRPSLN